MHRKHWRLVWCFPVNHSDDRGRFLACSLSSRIEDPVGLIRQDGLSNPIRTRAGHISSRLDTPSTPDTGRLRRSAPPTSVANFDREDDSGLDTQFTRAQKTNSMTVLRAGSVRCSAHGPPDFQSRCAPSRKRITNEGFWAGRNCCRQQAPAETAAKKLARR